MGQTLRVLLDSFNRFEEHGSCNGSNNGNCFHLRKANNMPDLSLWPPELSLNVLKNLNATDLCLASCVWSELAKDELLWQSLCHSQWSYVAIYFKPKPEDFSYYKLYLKLDELSVTFNAEGIRGINYFIEEELIEDEPDEIAKLIFHAKPFDRVQVRYYLEQRPKVLEQLTDLFDFTNQTLPFALRKYFDVLDVPNKYNHYLHLLVDNFSRRYLQCNPKCRHPTNEIIFVLCFSLIMLSADLVNPHIKNKMSKREFIRNVRRALRVTDDEYYGHLYDDIYLHGHIADASIQKLKKGSNQILFQKPFHTIF